LEKKNQIATCRQEHGQNLTKFERIRLRDRPEENLKALGRKFPRGGGGPEREEKKTDVNRASGFRKDWKKLEGEAPKKLKKGHQSMNT